MDILAPTRYHRSDFICELHDHIQLNLDGIHDFVFDNYPQGFRTALENYYPPRPGGVGFLKTSLAGSLSSSYSKALNNQIPFDYDLYNFGIPLFNDPTIFISQSLDEYPLHTDPRRPASLNFLLHGEPEDSTTYFKPRKDRFEFQYSKHSALLFNTQVPHGVIPHNANLRVLLTFRCSIGFQHFMSFMRQGLIFHDEQVIRSGDRFNYRTNPIPEEPDEDSDISADREERSGQETEGT